MAAILLVCSNAGSPAPGTQDLETLFEASPFSHTVTLRSDETGEQENDESNFALVVIDESVSSSTTGTDYKSYTIPRLMMETFLWDDNDLATNQGTEVTDTVEVANDGHPLCDSPTDLGTNGTDLVIANSDGQLGKVPDGDTASSRIDFIQRTSNTDNNGFAFENGAALLNSFTATSRIVALGWYDNIVDDLTTLGEDILENVFEWLLAGGAAATSLIWSPGQAMRPLLVQ